MPDRYYLTDGTPISLGPEFASGGEGAIRTVDGHSGLVAKLYRTHEMASGRREKIEAMLSNPPADPMAPFGHHSIAWPVGVVFEDAGCLRFAGFVMPKAGADAKKAHFFFQPEDRLRFTPAFDFRYLVTAARNIASAISAIHAVGHCVGDINESNILITQEAMVTLIDTDSFQVRTPTGRLFRCPVGKREYLAPELIGRSLETVDRTVATDDFALAVVLFQLLMQGFHPFSGTLLAGTKEPLPLDERIRRRIFVYTGHHGYRRPSKAPPFELLPPKTRDAFEQSFTGDGRHRPTAAQWVKLLDETLQHLVECPQTSLHVFPQHLKACPWCALYDDLSVSYFPQARGLQVKLSPPSSTDPQKAREEYLVSHISVALTDGYLAPESEGRLRQLAQELDLEGDFTRLIERELSRTGARRGTPQTVETARLALSPLQVDFEGIEPHSGTRTQLIGYSNFGRGALRGKVTVEPKGPFSVSPETVDHNQGQIRITLDTAKIEWDRAYTGRLKVEYNGEGAGSRMEVPIRARVSPNAVLDEWIGERATCIRRLTLLMAAAVAWWGMLQRQEPVRLVVDSVFGLAGRWLQLPVFQHPDLVWQLLISASLLGVTGWATARHGLILFGSWASGCFTGMALVFVIILAVLVTGLTKEVPFEGLMPVSASILTAVVPLLIAALTARVIRPRLRRWLLRGGWQRKAGAIAALLAPGLAVGLELCDANRLPPCSHARSSRRLASGGHGCIGD